MERSATLPPAEVKQWLTPTLAILWFTAMQAYFRWPLTGGAAALIILVTIPLTLRLLNRIWPHSWAAVGAVVIVMITSMAEASFMTSIITRQLVAGRSGVVFF